MNKSSERSQSHRVFLAIQVRRASIREPELDTRLNQKAAESTSITSVTDSVTAEDAMGRLWDLPFLCLLGETFEKNAMFYFQKAIPTPATDGAVHALAEETNNPVPSPRTLSRHNCGPHINFIEVGYFVLKHWPFDFVGAFC